MASDKKCHFLHIILVLSSVKSKRKVKSWPCPRHEGKYGIHIYKQVYSFLITYQTEVTGHLHAPVAHPPGKIFSRHEYEAAMARKSGHEPQTLNIQIFFLLSQDRNVNLSATLDTKTQHRAQVMNAIQSILPTSRSSKNYRYLDSKFSNDI